MSMLRMLARDRRLTLLLLLAAAAVIVSRIVLSPAAAVTTVVKGGYWAAAVLLVLCARATYRVVRDAWRRQRPGRKQVAALALVCACGGVLLAHERYGFKILADELLLLGTSMDMHFERSVTYPIRATDIQGPFQVLQNVIDKRPFFYPFLVSLVHDVTGYRPENAFYVNTALGFVFLYLLFLIGSRLSGNAWGGVLLLFLFTGLPLLAQQMKGGGFELLNLVMIATVLLLGIEFAERRDAVSLEALCTAAALLAYTRYESVIMLLPVGLLVLWGWWRENRVVLTMPVVFLPVFLLFPLVQNRVFILNTGAWELASRPGATDPFGLHYIPDNLGHALGFFFDLTGYQPNSPWFAAIGLLATGFFLIWIVRVLRTPRVSAPAEVATAFIGLGLFGILGLLMCYFWGQFDHPVIHRLSLPVHLLMAVAVAAVGASLTRRVRIWQFACVAAVGGLVVYSLPAMSRRAYASEYSPSVEMEWRTEFLRRYPRRDYLFIDNDSVFWITHQVPATAAVQAREREEGLIYHLRADSFSAMYVLQHFRVDPQTGERKLVPADDIGPDFQLEPVWEKRIETLFIGRISKITAIKKNGDMAAKAGMVAAAKGPERSTAELDAAKKAYVDNWLKQLP